jgi:Xaa-Pro aminopeptidase
VVRLRAYRVARLQAELVRHDYAAALLLDPINIRYATGSRNMSLWTANSPAQYCLVPACGNAILGTSTTASIYRPTLRPSVTSSVLATASTRRRRADEIADVIAQHCGRSRRIAIDRLDPPGSHALEGHSVQIFDGQAPNVARSIKSEDEIACIGPGNFGRRGRHGVDAPERRSQPSRSKRPLHNVD